MASKKRPATRKSTGATPAKTAKAKSPAAAKTPPASETSTTGFDDFQNIFQDKKHELCELLRTECEFIVECRICKSLFRSVANFAQHKRSYCLEKATTGTGKGAKRGTPNATPTSPRGKSRRGGSEKKVANDALTRELEEAMLDMGEGGEEERLAAEEQREKDQMDTGAAEEESAPEGVEGREQGKPPAGKQRPWSAKTAALPSAERPLTKFMAANAAAEAKPRKSTPLKADAPPVDQGNTCVHCGKVFMNRAGRVSHERYCANLTMKPLLGRGLAFADDYSADLSSQGGSDEPGPAPASSSKSYAVAKKPAAVSVVPTPVQGMPKQIVALPKGQIFQQRDEHGVLQTYLLTNINGEQKAIPVKPAPAPHGAPAGTLGRTIVKVAVGAKAGPPAIIIPAAAAVVKPGPSSAVAATPSSPPPSPGTPTAAEPPKAAASEASKPPAQQGPQAPIPNHLQPDLVKLLKEFSNVSGTVFFSMPELVKLNGDPQSASRLKQLIAALPPAGLIASKPISSGVLTKIVLSRPVEGEQGALKVVVIESGYTSQMRLRTKRDAESPVRHSTPVPKPQSVPDEAMDQEESGESTMDDPQEDQQTTEEAEDVKNVVDKLFDENTPAEEEEEDDEEKLKKAKMFLPPPKPVLRKMDLKMDKLLQSAVSRQVSKKKQVKDGEGENSNDAEPTPGPSGENDAEALSQEAMDDDGHEGDADGVKDKLNTEQNDVTFKEMFAMPEEEEVVDEEAYMKAAMILTGEETKASVESTGNETEKNFRRSAFSRKK